MYEHAESFRSGALTGAIAGGTAEISEAATLSEAIGSTLMQHSSGIMDGMVAALAVLF